MNWLTNLRLLRSIRSQFLFVTRFQAEDAARKRDATPQCRKAKRVAACSGSAPTTPCPTLSLKRRHCVNLPQASPPTARGILTPHRCLGPLRAFGSRVVPSLYAWLSCCPSPPSRRLPSATRPNRLLPAAADTASAAAKNHTPRCQSGRNSPTRSARTAVPSRLLIQRLRTIWFGPRAGGSHRVTELSRGFQLLSPIPSPASRAMLSASVRLPPLPCTRLNQLPLGE